jgi:hypothetical protein
MPASKSTTRPPVRLSELDPVKLVTGIVADLCTCKAVGEHEGGECCERTGWTALVTVYLHANGISPINGDPMPSQAAVDKWIDDILEVKN